MTYTQVFTCDVCGATRDTENHWTLSFPSRDAETNQSILCFSSWNDEAAIDPANFHLCGENCAATYLTRFIAKQREEGAV